MLLQSDNLETINWAFEQLCPEALCSIFPSGPLVEICRAQPNFIAKTAAKPRIHIATSHFSEPSLKMQHRDTPISSKSSSNAGSLTHLDRLEAESIHIIREVMAHADNPVMLYSVGKDSSVMLHLARKAFYPSPPPFPLMHVDTRWKFKAMYEFRDMMAEESGMDLIVHINPEGVEKNINPFDHGSALHTDIMKTQGLKQALDAHKFDVAFGGARRDEEKSRAKERIFLSEAAVIAGIRKTSARKFGIFITAERTKTKVFGFSLYPIGLSLIFGSISIVRIFQLFPCTLPLSVQLCAETACLLWLMTTECSCYLMRPLKQPWFVFERWVATRSLGRLNPLRMICHKLCWNCCKVEPASARAAL